MQIIILSRARALYSTRRLAEAARRRGHDVRVVDPHALTVALGPGGPRLTGLGAPIGPETCVIPRIASVSVRMVCALLEAADHAGALCLNPARGIIRARDKYGSLFALNAAGIGIPRTAMLRHSGGIGQAIEAVGGAPVVIKLREGTQGIGVMKADSPGSASSIVQALWSLDESVLIQEFVAESQGSDLRLFVVDGEVVAAMRRSAAGAEFRSNLHLGGYARRASASGAMRAIARRAADIFGLRVAGVDLLMSDRGPLVAEVNPSPGLEGIEGVSGLDIAQTIVRCAEDALVRGD